MTQRLVMLAVQNWEDLDGLAVSRGLDDLRLLPLDRFVHFVWWWATRNTEKAEREKFRRQLWQPPKGEEATEGPWSPQEETKAFQALKQSLGK